MTRGVKLDPDVRAAVIADLRATHGTPEGSVRMISDRHGVPRSTISRIAKDEGLTNEVGHARMQNAIQTRLNGNAEIRAELASRMLRAANRALSDMEASATIYNFGGKDNTYNERTVNRPPTADQRNLMIIAATAIDKHKVLDQYDSDARTGAMLDRWLNAMIGEDQSDEQGNP